MLTLALYLTPASIQAPPSVEEQFEIHGDSLGAASCDYSEERLLLVLLRVSEPP